MHQRKVPKCLIHLANSLTEDASILREWTQSDVICPNETLETEI
jgi:hypothetical protein